MQAALHLCHRRHRLGRADEDGEEGVALAPDHEPGVPVQRSSNDGGVTLED